MTSKHVHLYNSIDFSPKILFEMNKITHTEKVVTKTISISTYNVTLGIHQINNNINAYNVL